MNATETKGQYTPGPWRIEFDRNEQANIYAENEEFWIALLPHQCVASIEEIQIHNAALIAAAPDLLAALKDMRVACEALLLLCVSSERVLDALITQWIRDLARLGIADGVGARADAVIAKAEGVQ